MSRHVTIRLPGAGPVRLWLREGSGPRGTPLLLLHGLGITGRTWHRVLGPLAELRTVYAPDLPGFGRSDKPRGMDYSPPGIARAVTALMDALELPRAVLVGHSMGGGIALATATQQPERVAGLVLVDSAAYDQPVPPAIRLSRLPLAALGLRLVPRWLLRLGFTEAYYRKDAADEETLREYLDWLLRGRGPEGYVAAARALRFDRFRPVVDRLPELRMPALILHGDRDPVVPLWVSERLHAAIPGSSLEVLPGIGHMPQEEAPDTVLDRLRPWLEAETA